MFSKSINIAKWGTWFQDGSVQWSILYVIKNLIQWSEVHTQEDSIKWSEEPVIKKIQYSEMMRMYSRRFNNVKWSTCTQETSIHWSKVHVLKKLQYREVRYMYLRSFNTL